MKSLKFDFHHFAPAALSQAKRRPLVVPWQSECPRAFAQEQAKPAEIIVRARPRAGVDSLKAGVSESSMA